MSKDELLKKLKSNDKQEIRDAILELEKYEESDVIKAIIDTIIENRAKQILNAGIDVLLNFKNKKDEIAKNAIKLIFTDSPKLRHAGIDLLISCGDYTIDILEEKILKNQDYNIRKYGLDVLKEIKTERSLELIEKLTNDENPNVKYSAIEFLMNFTKFRDKVIKILKNVLKNESFDNLYGATTIASTIIFGQFFDKTFIPILREKLKLVKDDLIKHWIYKILIYLKDIEIIEEAKENAKRVDMLNVIENDIELALNSK